MNAVALGIIGSAVELRERPDGSWIGRCPFHDDTNPSFAVSADGLWYCFACDEGGDTVDFVMKRDNIPFLEAVKRVKAASPPERTETDA